MSKLSTAVLISLLTAAGFVHAQSSADRSYTEPGQNAVPSSSRDPAADTSGASGTAGSRASGSPVTTEGNKALGTSIRGKSGSASPSDRETSRTWSGVGSTGGATGTGTSSGTTDDPPTSGSGQAGTSSSGRGTGTGGDSGDSINESREQKEDGLREPGGSR